MNVPVASPGVWAKVRAALPEGRENPEPIWRSRHWVVVVFVAVHAVGLTLFGLARGWGPVYSFVEGGILAALAVIAAWPGTGRRFRSSVAALGAVTASAVLVQFWGGVIEAHFHFFVVVALISLYQDWVPFLLAILYVAVDHGVIGTLAPTWVYNHPEALAHPWKWALIHAAFVLSECAILVAAWKSNELAREETDEVLRSAGEAIMGVDENGRVTFANPAASAMTGVAAPALVGMPVERLVQTVNARPFVLPGGLDVAHAEARVGALPVQAVVTPIVKAGERVGSVVSLTDVSEIKAAQEQVRSLNADLERRIADRTRDLAAANKELEAFSYSVSHDLRSPLRSIDGFSKAVIDDHGASLPEDARHQLARVRENTQKMARLIDDMLQLSRVTRTELRKERVDLSTMVNVLSEDLRKNHPGRHVEFHVPPGIKAVCDPRLMGIALTNLLENAWKFTSRHPRARIEFGEAAMPDGARAFYIKDDGAGFEMAYANKLFTAFQRLHTTNEFEGTGVGLATVHRIVAKHGGRVWAEGVPEKGATFWFTVEGERSP